MIVTMFPDSREQAKAIGVFAFVASAGGSIGLLLGGILTEAINWHWIFFVNLPIGLVTAVLARRLIAPDRGIGFGEGADVPGALLITSSLMLAVYTIVKPAAEDGWGAPQTLALGAVVLGLLALFVAREAATDKPLIPLRIFSSRTVTGANIVQALSVAAMFGQGFLGALYLQRVLGYTALEIGLAYVPMTVLMGSLSLGYTERLNTRFGARNTLVAGLALISVALGLFSMVPVSGSYVTHVLPTMLLLGVGAGLAFPALMTLAMADTDPSEAGLASGLVNTTVQVGGAIGLAVLATLASTRTGDLLAAGQSAPQAMTEGYQLAFLIATILTVAAIAVALTMLTPQGSRQERRATSAATDAA
jgi:MFS family permease